MKLFSAISSYRQFYIIMQMKDISQVFLCHLQWKSRLSDFIDRKRGFGSFISARRSVRHNVINLSNLKVRGLSFKVGKPKAQSHN
jgi:hypothetical protein